MAFNHPEAVWLFIIPILVIVAYFALRLMRTRDARRFADDALFASLTVTVDRRIRRIKSTLFVAGLVCIVAALTEPRFGLKTEIVKRRGADIVIALDISYSMLAEDVKPNRLLHAKYEIQNLIGNLTGDRVALIAFAGKPFVQYPLTADYAAARTLLDGVDVGIISEQGTNLGGAVDEALHLIEKGTLTDSQSRILIIFSDGENLEGDIEAAARRAASLNVRIFTVGIGTTDGDIIPIRDETGDIVDYKKDIRQNVVKTSLDEKNLKILASVTGGSYIQASGGNVDLQLIIDQLGALDKKELYERKITRLKERYQIPLGLALVCLIAWLVLPERKKNTTYTTRTVGS